MTDDSTAGIDRSKPSIARVYDYLLGGTDNFAVDREVGDFFLRELPGSAALPFANRQALIRAVGAMAGDGVRQFVDLGSGLPTADNVHQAARRHDAGARVVYVDNDPTVLAHGRALLAADPRTTLVRADLREPEEIRRHPEVRRLIDFDEPVGVVFSAVLHHLDDAERPADLVRWWVDRIPSGSLVYVSHFRSVGSSGGESVGTSGRTSGGTEEGRSAERKLRESFGRGRWRTDEEILGLLDGLDLLEPGLVPCPLWRPEPAGTGGVPADEGDLSVWERLISCALARKP
ncbi:SAM-dependent methyltransferase [Kitasatospora xanthocidica]|uniref:SAM-dependent methyltransferase n=1 Tax=Kitasatospora xanthocidica TaxID=83382 RepID=A0A372ZMX9_9ACTN|nr:SAM-dependent methyltransferase [Kitasatospora xanthocidica]RGD57193.1 SAM-dependent methyltransferase [Kitasatospora xanthocidica]